MISLDGNESDNDDDQMDTSYMEPQLMLDEYDEPVEFKFDPHAANGNSSSNRSATNNTNDDDDLQMGNNCATNNHNAANVGGTNGGSGGMSNNIANASLVMDVEKHQQQAARQQALLLAAQNKHQQQLLEAAAAAAAARNAKMSAIVASGSLPGTVTLLNSMVNLPKLEPIVKSVKPRVNKRSKVKQNGIKAETSNTSSVSRSKFYWHNRTI